VDQLPAVLVVGEAIVDEFHLGETVDRRAGGSPTNVAVGLGRLGHPVSELTCIAGDDNGALIRAYLDAAGVALHPDAPAARATPRAEVTLDANGDARYRFAIEWRMPPAVDIGAAAVVHTGSIALALEPGASGVLEFLRGLRDHVRVSIDPNVRAAFFPDPSGAARHLEPFLRRADLVKLSVEDATFLYPDLALDAVLDHLLGLGPGLVAVTQGKDGATLATAGARVHVPAGADTLVDTVGAGDSFMAALISIVSRSGDWEPAASRLLEFGRDASRAAAITLSHRGAYLPSSAELPLDSPDA
jgi:fructokinase